MRRDHRHGNAPRQHPRRYRRRRTAVPFHEQTLPPMVLPMRYPGRPPPPPPPGAGSKVRAAAPRRRGGVGARITAIVSPPRWPRSRGSSSHQNSAPRHEPVDPPDLRDGGRDRRRISGAALQARHIPRAPPLRPNAIMAHSPKSDRSRSGASRPLASMRYRIAAVRVRIRDELLSCSARWA